MPEPFSPILSHHLSKAETTSTQFAVLASLVGQTITSFQTWLRKLPSVLETTVWIDHPNPPPSCETDMKFGIAIMRGKSEWGLFWNQCGAPPDEDAFVEPTEGWEPIESATMVLKATAVTMLPRLVKTMNEEQEQVIRHMLIAAKTVGATANNGAKEGK
ncbi:MAG: hypothetical protein QM770_08395 [Tepidisphaeraceae bacterium]